MPIFIIEDPRPARPKIGEPHRNVVVLKLRFHEKVIAQIDGVGVKRIKLVVTRGVGVNREAFGAVSDPGNSCSCSTK